MRLADGGTKKMNMTVLWTIMASVCAGGVYILFF